MHSLPRVRAPRLPDPIREQSIGPDRVLVVSDDLALVASATDPGAWHLVTWSPSGDYCTCAGHYYRGRCRHHEAAHAAMAQLAAAALHPAPPSAAPLAEKGFVR